MSYIFFFFLFDIVGKQTECDLDVEEIEDNNGVDNTILKKKLLKNQRKI